MIYVNNINNSVYYDNHKSIKSKETFPSVVYISLKI